MPTQYGIYVQYESHRYKELANIQSHTVLLNRFISSFEKVNVFLISAAVLFLPHVGHHSKDTHLFSIIKPII